MSKSPATAPSRLRRLPGVAVLVLALLWAQLLGLAHGVRHAGGPGYGVAKTAAVQKAAPAGPLAHLLAPAGDDGDCRLYDQLGHGAPQPPLPAVLPAAVPVFLAWPLRLVLRSEPCAAFAARAPPLSR